MKAKRLITKVISVFCLTALLLMAFSGCERASGEFNVYVTDGVNIAALASSWGEKVEDATFDYMVTTESTIASKMTNGEPDFIIAPINVGAQIHNAYTVGSAPHDYKLMNVTSWGVLYFVSNMTAHKTRAACASARDFLAQFEGAELTTIGIAAIPGKTVNYILDTEKISASVIGSDAAAIQTKLIAGDDMLAVFAEPAITATSNKIASLGGKAFSVLASVGDIYNELTGNAFPMAGMFVRGDIFEADKVVVEAFNRQIKSNIEAFNADPAAAWSNIEDGFISTLSSAAVAAAAPRMNVAFKTAAQSKPDVTKLLSCLGIEVTDSFFCL